MSCNVVNADCKNSDIVKQFKELLSNTDKLPIPISKKSIEETQKALDKYIIECRKCAQEARNDYRCHEAAITNLQRRTPMFADSIYPWKNYDWNYGNYVSNNYSPERTGATPEGSFSAVFKNGRALVKLVNGILSDPIPNTQSKAGEVSINSDYPNFESCKDNTCRVTEEIRTSFQQEPPTKDDFLKKNINGENSSSYYFKVGSCPRPDIKTKTQCENNGYTWTEDITGKTFSKMTGQSYNDEIDGNCSQPRYAYIDNTPKAFFNGSNMKGTMPTMINDIATLMPDKVIATLLGNSISDSYVIQQCPKVDNIKEGFQSIKKTNDKYDILYGTTFGIFIALSIIIYLFRR